MSDEAGFTLVELMVVILIIAILIAIAVPTFFGLKRRADDVAAKEAVMLTLKTARSLEDGSYASVTAADLAASQPGLTFVDGATPSSGPDVVSQEVVGGDTIYISAFSVAGTCFFVEDELDAGTAYGRITPAGVPDCNAGNNGAVAFGPNW
ncbi:MAG TPA: prepilin-type N-terminal cleavage/methylation domain-containing protein [Actinomycetota bacterium]|nr:prepilin-type N-terminal cleavage/methylation domain-containing protein [Actinomycetota bacterium]